LRFTFKYFELSNFQDETSPQVYARIGGMAYLIIFLAGGFDAMFIRNSMIVWGDAAATTNHIMASQLLWRVGIAGDLLMHVCDVVVMMVFYVLLRPVNRNLALLVVLFNVIQTAVLVANKLNLLVPILLFGSPEYQKMFEPQQLQALTYLCAEAHEHGFGIGLIFFGFECLVLGHLIFKSGYLPRTIGILMQIAGLSYLINSFTMLLAPTFANRIFPAILLFAFPGEVSLCLWLLVKGVNITKWKEKSARVNE
jgi:hypothetical protein